MNAYITKIWWDAESECFIATCPALQGCMTHGKTRAEAERHIQEAMEVWLESARMHGDPIPDPAA